MAHLGSSDGPFIFGRLTVRRVIIWSLVALGSAMVYLGNVHSALFDNGFDLSDTSIPADEIHHGGPPRDGIPAIDEPRFITVDEAEFLDDEDRVLALVRHGLAKAYPVRILNYHEIVNDAFGEHAIVVTYCPLCGSGMAFNAEVAGQRRSFGVSGLLYNSDVLLYDRESESLWSQIMARAVSGKLKGTRLAQLPLSHTTWRDWRTRHPQTLVLSPRTGYARDYSRTPYQGYDSSAAVYFPVGNTNPKYHPKELVIGVSLNGENKAYPFAELSMAPKTVRDVIGGQSVQVEFDARNRTGRVLDAKGAELPSTIVFWFAWVAFHPDGNIYEAGS